MKQINSLINMQVLKNNLKQYWLIGLGYVILLFLIFPLSVIMSAQNYVDLQSITKAERLARFVQYFLNFTNGGQIVLMIVVILPVLLAILIFKYMQHQSSVTFMHGLPATRTQLLNTGILTGKIILILPTVLIGLIVMVEKWAYGLTLVTYGSIFKWVFIVCILSLFMFMFTTFVGLCIGNSIIQGVVSYILLILPFVIGVTIFYTLSELLSSYVVQTAYIEKLEYISPIARMMGIYREHSFGIKEMVFYIIAMLVIYILSIYVYKLRKSESATESVCFDILKPIFKYGVAFCATITVGILMMSLQRSSSAWLIFGYIVGSILGYFIAEMILKKSIYIFKSSYKGFVAYILLFFILFGLVKVDAVGFKRRVPKLSQIKSANFSNEFEDSEYDYASRRFILIPPKSSVTEEENIKQVMEIHKKLIDSKGDQNVYDIRNGYVTYELKNGTKMVRKYSYTIEEIETELRPLYESREYKMKKYQDIFNMDMGEFTTAYLYSAYLNKQLQITSKKEAAALLEALKQDVLAEKFEQMVSEERQATVEFNVVDTEAEQRMSEYGDSYPRTPEKSLKPYIVIKRSYMRTYEFLDDHDYYDKIILSAKDVKQMIVYRKEETSITESGDLIETRSYYYNSKEDDFDSVKENYRHIIIDDKGDMEMYIQMLSSDYSKYDFGYRIGMVLYNDEKDYERFVIGTFENNQIPKKIVDALE